MHKSNTPIYLDLVRLKQIDDALTSMQIETLGKEEEHLHNSLKVFKRRSRYFQIAIPKLKHHIETISPE
jgi:hypothetical protein